MSELINFNKNNPWNFALGLGVSFLFSEGACQRWCGEAKVTKRKIVLLGFERTTLKGAIYRLDEFFKCGLETNFANVLKMLWISFDCASIGGRPRF